MLTAVKALNQPPTNGNNTDFSRVRAFCLNGWSGRFRQTVLLGPRL
eukprot:SAG22_NODE_15126_length_356_cov_0.809339_2_plen_45_part_01